MDVTMLATAHVSGSEEVMRLQSDFVLQDMSTTTSTTYLCSENARCESKRDQRRTSLWRKIIRSLQVVGV